jgi:hypothetical protein
MCKFIIETSSDEESLRVYLNGKYVISANHDNDGWHGISAIKNTINTIADILDIDVEYSEVE